MVLLHRRERTEIMNDDASKKKKAWNEPRIKWWGPFSVGTLLLRQCIFVRNFHFKTLSVHSKQCTINSSMISISGYKAPSIISPRVGKVNRDHLGRHVGCFEPTDVPQPGVKAHDGCVSAREGTSKLLFLKSKSLVAFFTEPAAARSTTRQWRGRASLVQ